MLRNTGSSNANETSFLINEGCLPSQEVATVSATPSTVVKVISFGSAMKPSAFAQYIFYEPMATH